MYSMMGFRVGLDMGDWNWSTEEKQEQERTWNWQCSCRLQDEKPRSQEKLLSEIAWGQGRGQNLVLLYENVQGQGCGLTFLIESFSHALSSAVE